MNLLLLPGITLKAAEQADSVENFTSLSTKKIMLSKSPWSQSENASALVFFDYNKKIGSASVYSEIQEKSYHRFREGDALFKTGFATDGFVKYKNWNFYGNFNYFNQNEKNTKWTGVMNPYNENPYSIGDSVGGNYSKEYFNMEGQASLTVNKNLFAGTHVKYSSGVGAKRKDPRPENTITSFTISPGIVIRKNNIKLGASFCYEAGKEDIEISDVTDNTYSIFHFKGLGVFSSTPEYDKQIYVFNSVGGGFQFNFDGTRLQNLTEINFHKTQTDIKRGETYPLQVALFEKFHTHIYSTFIFSTANKNISRLNLFFTDNHLYGHEPVVEPKLQSISYQWSTAAKYTLYWQKENEVGLKYSYYKIIDKHHFNWGGQFSASGGSNKTTYYFVPEYNRQNLNMVKIDVILEKGFQTNKGDIILEINGGMRKNYNGRLTLVDDANLLSTVNTQMVTHDFNYYNSGLLYFGVSVKAGKNLRGPQNWLQVFAEAGIKNMISELSGNPDAFLLNVKLGINF